MGVQEEQGTAALKAPAEGIEEKEEEELVVEKPHTVAHPGTVVVHLPHARIADRTVVSPWGFDLSTLVAIPELDVVPHLRIELPIY
jgi:hypothetical protein